MERSLPNAVGPEKSILSSMMQDPSGLCVDLAIEKGITKECFYVPAHGQIFKRLLECSNKGLEIELVSLTQWFEENGVLEDLGGASGLGEIYTYAVTNAHFNHHCKLVLEKYKLREVISKCTSLISEAYEEPEEVDSFIDGVESKIFSISRQFEYNETVSNVNDLLKNSIKNLEDFLSGKKKIEGLPTRLKVFNDLTKGLKKGEMIVFAARPSMGKTALMCNLIEDLTCMEIPGIVFSCEMTSQQLMDRILFGRAKFPMHFMKSGCEVTKKELVQIQEAYEDLVNKKLFIDDKSAISIEEVRAKARRKKKEEDIKYLAVDYIQLMTTEKKCQNRELEVSYISHGLKALAKELNIPVIVLAQLNRNPERRSDGIPKMSDLRESGSLEQDLDVLGLIHRANYYSDEQEEEPSDGPNSTETNASLIIAKNRNGPTGVVEMKWNKETMQFI